MADHAAAHMAWLDARTGAAPPALRDRVLRYAAGGTSAGSRPAALAEAAATALAAVTACPGDRSVALDLLAADALITLALLAQAEEDPAELGTVAAELLAAYGAPA